VKRNWFDRIIGVGLLLVMISGCGLAQTFGIKTAYPLSNAFQTSPDPNVTYTFSGRIPKIGLTAEIRLPVGLLLEVDGLYSRLDYTSTGNGMAGITNSTSVNCWDFPILVKRGVTLGAIKPYVDGGFAFRAVNAAMGAAEPNSPSERPLEFTHQGTGGYAFGGGIEFKIRKLHLLPELRDMRFRRDNFQSPTNTFHSNLKQPQFLLGFQIGR
jgi:opacity protein-like surface antigen